MTSRLSWALALTLSLLIHLLLAGGLQLVPLEWSNINQPELTEIVLVKKDDQTLDNERQMVRESLPPEKLLKDNTDDPARFSSEQTKRVILETKARDIGLTRNTQGTLKPNSWLRELRQNRQVAAAEKRQNQDGYEPIPLPGPRDAHAFDDAPSTVGETLPEDISIGDFTALNTDRFQFYSFYSRVEELIRFRWENSLKQAIDSFDRNYSLSVIGKKNWVTGIEFLLTPDGHFHSARIFRQSGIERFDLAAVWAFRDAGFFPNPPAEMVKEGFIRLNYTFNVHWNPGTLVTR